MPLPQRAVVLEYGAVLVFKKYGEGCMYVCAKNRWVKKEAGGALSGHKGGKNFIREVGGAT